MSERQMACTLEEVRLDHRRRYEFACDILKKTGRTRTVLDAGCGVGYGSAMLSRIAEQVISIEMSSEAAGYYKAYWEQPNIDFKSADLLQYELNEKVDAIVCFEFIEHVECYDAIIANFARWSDFLIISTPNELVRPHLQEPVNPFHFRHFTPDELAEVLQRYGFGIDHWHCQRNGSQPEILPGTNGKFIIAVASRRA